MLLYKNRNPKPFKISNHNRNKSKNNNKTKTKSCWLLTQRHSFTDASWLRDSIFGFDKGAANGLIWSEDDLTTKKKKKNETKRNETNTMAALTKTKFRIQKKKKKFNFLLNFYVCFCKQYKRRKNLNFYVANSSQIWCGIQYLYEISQWAAHTRKCNKKLTTIWQRDMTIFYLNPKTDTINAQTTDFKYRVHQMPSFFLEVL